MKSFMFWRLELPKTYEILNVLVDVSSPKHMKSLMFWWLELPKTYEILNVLGFRSGCRCIKQSVSVQYRFSISSVSVWHRFCIGSTLAKVAGSSSYQGDMTSPKQSLATQHELLQPHCMFCINFISVLHRSGIG